MKASCEANAIRSSDLSTLSSCSIEKNDRKREREEGESSRWRSRCQLILTKRLNIDNWDASVSLLEQINFVRGTLTLCTSRRIDNNLPNELTSLSGYRISSRKDKEAVRIKRKVAAVRSMKTRKGERERHWCINRRRKECSVCRQSSLLVNIRHTDTAIICDRSKLQRVREKERKREDKFASMIRRCELRQERIENFLFFVKVNMNKCLQREWERNGDIKTKTTTTTTRERENTTKKSMYRSQSDKIGEFSAISSRFVQVGDGSGRGSSSGCFLLVSFEKLLIGRGQGDRMGLGEMMEEIDRRRIETGEVMIRSWWR